MAGKSKSRKQKPSAETNLKTQSQPTTGQPRRSIADRLLQPVDITFLIYFRIAFGLLALWLGWQYWERGLIARYYAVPEFHFKFYGFGWVEPWPDFGRGQTWLNFDWIEPSFGNGVHLQFLVLGLLAAFITLGLFYRLSTILFCLGFTHIFLLEQTRYLNHYYLMILLSFILVLVPAHRACSLDVLMRPKLRSLTTPSWTLRIMQLQFGLVYFWAGVTKCNMDWIYGEPIRSMLYNRVGVPEFDGMGYFFTEEHLFTQEWLILGMSWSGLLFDLLVYPLLLWRKTRVLALIVSLLFHGFNTQVFVIDIFPWMMMAATLILFFPDWLPFHRTTRPDATLDDEPSPIYRDLKWSEKAITGIAGLYVVIQLILPLRPYFYSGDASWNDEGHRFSWRMMARIKLGSRPQFIARFRNPEGELVTSEILVHQHHLDPNFWSRHWQYRKLPQSPDMILQCAQWQREKLRERGNTEIDIRALVKVSLNTRKYQNFIDPNVNLANEPRRFLTPYPWVLPLVEPFPSEPPIPPRRPKQKSGA